MNVLHLKLVGASDLQYEIHVIGVDVAQVGEESKSSVEDSPEQIETVRIIATEITGFCNNAIHITALLLIPCRTISNISVMPKHGEHSQRGYSPQI